MCKKIFLCGKIFVITLLGILFLAQADETFAGQHAFKGYHPYFQGKAFTAPDNYVSVTLGGFKFCFNNGTCRAFRRQNYAFVPAPVVCVPERVIAARAPVVKEISENTVVVTIPNLRGSYTSVIITKRGNGYIGPQGEYYPDGPTVAQLQLLYGN